MIRAKMLRYGSRIYTGPGSALCIDPHAENFETSCIETPGESEPGPVGTDRCRCWRTYGAFQSIHDRSKFAIGRAYDGDLYYRACLSICGEHLLVLRARQTEIGR